eukprot:scaffold312384_cov39-Prasinocladus_malaysianus.AAC.1
MVNACQCQNLPASQRSYWAPLSDAHNASNEALMGGYYAMRQSSTQPSAAGEKDAGIYTKYISRRPQRPKLHMVKLRFGSPPDRNKFSRHHHLSDKKWAQPLRMHQPTALT